MAKVKTKDQETTLQSWGDVDENLREIAKLKNSVIEEETMMNQAILEVQANYQPGLNSYNAKILGMEKDIELFCKVNKDAFAGKKTKELNYGLVSFRTGTPKLATLKGFTWDAVKNLVKTSKKLTALFIRVKEDLDKQKILSSGMNGTELAKIGVHITQEESFSYEVYSKESKEVV